MSGGTDARRTGITSPSASAGPPPLSGMSATYCSPIADVLCTSAPRSAGMGTSERSDSSALTPASVSRTALTRPTLVPR